jgi:hypothetical protein
MASPRAFSEDTGIILLQNNIRFCGEMIFLKNFPVPVIAPEGFERGHEFQN